jgi:hypothetical protein
MPIHLTTPESSCVGPDGQGTNRIAIGSLAGDECALRPRSIAALVEAWDTRRARYGGFGACTNHGDCRNCPWLAALAEPLELPVLDIDERVWLRVNPADGRVYLLHQPEKGWDSWGYSWSWDELARLNGWAYDGRLVDEHGESFWLRRSRKPTTHA